VLIDANFVLSRLPMPLMTVMIASAIPAAISPYSIQLFFHCRILSVLGGLVRKSRANAGLRIASMLDG
jgi:hypothetical protein